MSDFPWTILQEEGRTGSELRCLNSPGNALWILAKCCQCSNRGEKEEEREEGALGRKRETQQNREMGKEEAQSGGHRPAFFFF